MSYIIFLFLFLIFCLMEIFYYKVNGKNFPYLNSFASLISYLFSIFIFKFFFETIIINFYMLVYNNSLLKINVFVKNSTILFVLSFVLVDFIYYLSHRISHQIEFFWISHRIHHTIENLTFLTATAQSYISSIIHPKIIFFVLLSYLGLHPFYFLFSYFINLVLQLFIHTEIDYNFPLAERILNSPSLHRVHHSNRAIHYNKNFAGIFIIFDKIFGTYYCPIPGENFKYGIATSELKKDLFYIIRFETKCWCNYLLRIMFKIKNLCN